MKILSPLRIFTFLIISFFTLSGNAQDTDKRLYEIIDNVSADSIEHDIRKLAGFGTRNTFSDTVSDTRGIGAARRWIKSEFENISSNCDNCLDVFYQKNLVTPDDGERIPKEAWVVNVVAIQKGTKYPNQVCYYEWRYRFPRQQYYGFHHRCPGSK